MILYLLIVLNYGICILDHIDHVTVEQRSLPTHTHTHTHMGVNSGGDGGDMPPPPLHPRVVPPQIVFFLNRALYCEKKMYVYLK